MIIYGFYGMGKSTCIENDTTNLFTELDDEYVAFNQWSHDKITNEINELSNNHILFINGHLPDYCKHIDMAFMPKNIDIAVTRLLQRNTCNNFVEYIKQSYDEILEYVKNHVINIVYLDTEDYVTNYVDTITQLYKEQKGDENL